MTAEPEANRRRLTQEETVDLLSRPLVGVFSSLSEGGWIHSVPVHFLYRDGGLRFLASTRDVKARNVARSGMGTLCVEETAGSVRSYVSVSGAATTMSPPETSDLQALDAKYHRDDFSAGWDEQSFAAATMIVIAPERWIAWTDWD